MIRLTLTFFVLALTSVSAINLCHFVISDGAIYSFFGVDSTTIPSDYGVLSKGKISFDICGTSISSCSQFPPVSSDYTAVIVSDDDDHDCENLATGDLPTVNYINPSNSSVGVSLVYDTVSNGNIKNTFIVNVTCDKSISPTNLVWTSSLSVGVNGPNVYTLTSSGQPGCPAISLQSFLTFFNNYKIFFGILFFLIGFFVLTVGARFHKVTVFLFTLIVVTILLFAIIMLLTGMKTSGGVQWLIFVICLVLAGLCGYTAIRFQKFGFFCVGAIGGGVGAFFLYSLLLHFFTLTEVFMYVFIIVLALIGGLVTMCLWKYMIIIIMSFVGSYLMVRAVSFFTGGFPDELAVVEGLETFTYITYIYLGVIVGLAVCGIIFQYKHRKGAPEPANNEVELIKPKKK